MSSATQTKNITTHMVAFIKTHGGLDLDEFYEEHAESEVTDIIVEYTKMLLAAVKDDDNKVKLEGLAKKLTPVKSSRKKKDPDAPKRGKSAYIFFGQEYREKAKKQLIEEHGDDYKHTQVMSKLGEMWNELKTSTKPKDKKDVAKFEKMAEDDKERYEAEKEDYTPPSEEELSDKLSSKKKKKDPNAPKRGKSAYIFFGQEYREKAKEELIEEHGDDYKHTMVMAKLGEMWNELKASTKPKDKKAVAKFEKMAADDKERYEAEKEDYTPSTDEDEPEKKVAKKPSPKKEVKKPSPKKEVKKPSPKKEVEKKPSPKKEVEKKPKSLKEPAIKLTQKMVEKEWLKEVEEVEVIDTDSELAADKAGFRLWKQEEEENIKSDFPKLTPGKFLNKCIELWEGLDDKDRREWADEEAKEDYTGEGEGEEGEGEGEEGEVEEEGDY